MSTFKFCLLVYLCPSALFAIYVIVGNYLTQKKYRNERKQSTRKSTCKVIATEKTGKGLERKRPYTYNYN
jgi:hypothetical protein